MISDRTCTQFGRVVYDRKKHLFRYKDVVRIVKKIDAERGETPVSFYEFGQIEAALREIYHDYTMGLESVQLDRRHFIGFGVVWQSIAFGNRVLRLVPEWKEGNITVEWPR